MKKLFALMLLGGFAFLHACVGPMGPPGLQGPQGPQGPEGLIGQVYELNPVDLTTANDFSIIFEFPSPIFDTDKILNYVLWEVSDGEDVWRLLPQTVFATEGIFQYNYDFTRFDTRIFLDANFPRSQISNIFTRNLIFRVVILPADFGSARIDYNDFDGVMDLLKLSESDIVKLKSKKENQ